MALKPAQPKVEKKPLDTKPAATTPVTTKPVEQKPVDVKPDPNAVAGAPSTQAPVVVDNGAPPAPDEEKKKLDWNKFSSVAMSKTPVHTPMRGSVLNARIDVLKRPKPAPVAEESDE